VESIINFAPYTGWVYPNETVFEWSVLIAVYPYLTGLVAGAFTVSSLYQVFGFERLKPVACNRRKKGRICWAGSIAC
jgi:Ni/Fe-hydrogenase subunit HybB-like protein